MDNKVIIYNDGGYHSSTKIGGWAAILNYNNIQKEILGATDLETTSQRMELQSCIESLKQLKRFDMPVEIWSDSAYLVNCINQKWYTQWIFNNWKTKNKKHVKNKDLWKQILSLYAKFKDIKFFHIKGHNGNEMNEKVDKLVQKAIKKLEKEMEQKEIK